MRHRPPGIHDADLPLQPCSKPSSRARTTASVRLLALEAAQDRRDVDLHGAFGQAEVACDQLVRLGLCNRHPEYVELARRERGIAAVRAVEGGLPTLRRRGSNRTRGGT